MLAVNPFSINPIFGFYRGRVVKPNSLFSPGFLRPLNLAGLTIRIRLNHRASPSFADKSVPRKPVGRYECVADGSCCQRAFAHRLPRTAILISQGGERAIEAGSWSLLLQWELFPHTYHSPFFFFLFFRRQLLLRGFVADCDAFTVWPAKFSGKS